MSNSFEQNSVKERIRDAVDIVELVGQYVPLRRAGRNYVGRCPWHDDSRPSLQVNPERQTFKCWVCDIGGDVFAFIMKAENVDFREAIGILADKTGIALPKKSFGQDAVPTTENGNVITRKQLFHAADWIANLYHETLLHSEEAAVARNYLQQRNINDEAIKLFNIGYAPIAQNWLAGRVKNKPDRLQILEMIGNLGQWRSQSPDLLTATPAARFDFFRGRVIFPIRDEQGRTVAFGGRLIPDSPLANDPWHKDRKYLNSPETSLFSKHKVLYGLDSAKQYIKEKRRALIVEGYTDCITAHQFGFGEAVAVLGTALGPAHLRLLNRMGAEKIILMLDGDKAGQSKAESDKVLTDFIGQGADMAVLTLPEGLDPCDFLEQHGAEALNTLLQADIVDALEHVFRAKTRRIDLKNDIIGASKALDAILEIIAYAPIKGTSPDDPIRFRIEKTLQNLSVRFVMPEEEIRRRLKEKQRKIEQRPVRAEENSMPMDELPQWNKEQLPDLLERNMLELWITDPTAIYEFWERVAIEQFRSPITQSVYRQCSELIEEWGRPATFENLLTAFDDPQMKNYLIELELSGRKKFFGEDEDEINSAIRNELMERWKEPAFKELKIKLIEEIIGAFEHRESERKRRNDLNQLRNAELSEEDKTKQLIELQQKLRTK